MQIIKNFKENIRQHISIREALGLAILVLAVALVPVGWYGSRLFWLASVIGIVFGTTFFYTARMRKREEQIEKESAGPSAGLGMTNDLHNYTGWRTGGRRETPNDSFESSSEDAD